MEEPTTTVPKKRQIYVGKITIVRRIVQIFVIIFLNAVFWDSFLKIDLSFFQSMFRFVPFLSSPRSTFSDSGGFLELMLGSMVARIVPFLLFGLIIFVTIVFGRATCGWLCPAGLIQDLFGWAGIATKNNREMGITTHAYVSRLKNWILGLILLFIVPFLFIADNNTYLQYVQVLGDFGKNPLGFWSLDEFLFVFVPTITQDIATSGNLELLLSNWLYIVQGFFYLIIMILTFYYPRFYCRYLCPYGAITRPFAKHAITALSRNPTKCVGRKECGKCEKACPMQIRILDESYTRISGNGECILCGNCKQVCDKEKYQAIELSFFKS
nr:4Fe-4S binding protein [Candidatus Sigynarchaeota archaeon]